MFRDHLVQWLGVLAVACAAVARADEAAPPEAGAPASKPSPTVADPTVLLIRDEAVRAELECTDAQRNSLDSLLQKHNRLLLAIRDVGPTGANDAARPGLLQLRDQFTKILTPQQRARLQGLILQSQGYDSLLRNDIAAKLRLSTEQRDELAAISNDVSAKQQALQTAGAAGDPQRLQDELLRLQNERKDRILGVLDQQQAQRYAVLLGEPFDFTPVKPSPAAAPEFEGIETWINSEPLTMESLRGQVVVVHFFAFGCINCIHNYPWYNQWYNDLEGKGVAIVGIHTPETQTETDNELLRASLTKNELKFPVAVDKQKRMWQAWSNGIWPSVYIVDRQGRLRYWWYGELDWQGAGNQALARRQIELLLAESASTGPASSK